MSLKSIELNHSSLKKLYYFDEMKKNNLHNILKVITLENNDFYHDAFYMFEGLYESKYIHLPELMRGYIDLYVDGDDLVLRIEASNFKRNYYRKLSNEREFFYRFIFNSLNLSDLVHLSSYLKEIDINHDLPDETYGEIAESFKRNFDRIIDIVVTQKIDIHQKIQLI